MTDLSRDDFFDFNTAEPQQSFDIIPRGTLVKVHMNIIQGGYGERHIHPWADGYPTLFETGRVYLQTESVILAGEHKKRKIWTQIGLYSPKGPLYGEIGRSLIRSILNSARGLSDKDTSPKTEAARRTQGFKDLDDIEFVARLGIDVNDRTGEEFNVIKAALTPDHKNYHALFSQNPGSESSLPQKTNPVWNR